jgi:hypothetical protein
MIVNKRRNKMKNYVAISIEFELPDGKDPEELTTNDILDLFFQYHFKNKENQDKQNFEKVEYIQDLKKHPIIKFLMYDSWMASRIINFKKECLSKGKKANIQTTFVRQKDKDKINEDKYHEILDCITGIYNHIENKKKENKKKENKKKENKKKENKK